MATPPVRVSYHVQATSPFLSTGTSKTCTGVSFQVGDFLEIKASAEQHGTSATVTPTLSAGAATWTKYADQGAAGANNSGTWSWVGVVTAAASNVIVTLARPTGSNVQWGFTTSVIRGASGIGVRFEGNNGTASGAPSVTQTVQANSLLTCQVNDWNATDGASRTWRTVNGAPITEASYYRSASTHTVYGGYVADSGAGGSVTMGLTAPTTQRWVMSGFEFLGTAGTTKTPVTTTRGTSWRVRAAVAAVRSTTWRALSSVGLSRAAIWDTRVAVTTQRSTSWNVDGSKAPVTITRSTTWDTRAPVTASRAASWATKAQVSAARPTSWDVRRDVTTQRSTSWDTRALVSVARTTSYDVLVRVLRAASTTWDTRRDVTTQRSTAWNVDSSRVTVTAARTATWRTLARATASRPTSRATRQAVTVSHATSWDVCTAVVRQASTTWRTLFAVAGERVSSWRTLAPVTVTRLIGWAVAPSTAAVDVELIRARVDTGRQVFVATAARTVGIRTGDRVVQVTAAERTVIIREEP